MNNKIFIKEDEYAQIVLSLYMVMLEYSADVFKLIRSKIGRRIVTLVFIQIFFIIVSLIILSYYESQMTYLGNSINIAGKNRFLSFNLMYNTADFFLGNSSDVLLTFIIGRM